VDAFFIRLDWPTIFLKTDTTLDEVIDLSFNIVYEKIKDGETQG